MLITSSYLPTLTSYLPAALPVVMEVITAPRLTRVPGEMGRNAIHQSYQDHSVYATPPATQPSSMQNLKRAANGTPPKKNNCPSKRPLEDIPSSIQDHPSSTSRNNKKLVPLSPHSYF